jgi:hypothetical protein
MKRKRLQPRPMPKPNKDGLIRHGGMIIRADQGWYGKGPDVRPREYHEGPHLRRRESSTQKLISKGKKQND